MPEGTRVSNCVQDVKAKGGNANPYAVCQSSTGQNYKTGQALAELRKYFGGGSVSVTGMDEDSVVASASSTGPKLTTDPHPGGIEKLRTFFEGAEPARTELPESEQFRRLRKYCGGQGGQPGPCPTGQTGQKKEGLLGKVGRFLFETKAPPEEPKAMHPRMMIGGQKKKRPGPEHGRDYPTGGGGYY